MRELARRPREHFDMRYVRGQREDSRTAQQLRQGIVNFVRSGVVIPLFPEIVVDLPAQQDVAVTVFDIKLRMDEQPIFATTLGIESRPFSKPLKDDVETSIVKGDRSWTEVMEEIRQGPTKKGKRGI